MVKCADERLCCGFVGVGGFGATRRGWVRASGMFDIVGGVDIKDDALEAALAQEGPRFVPAKSVEELVARDEIDALFVCSASDQHLSHALAAARAGKHVFVEKPIGHDLAQTRELVELCEQRGLVLGVGFTRRSDPHAIAAKKYIDSGKLGTVVAADAMTMHCGALLYSPGDWRFRKESSPGGPLFHLGIHLLDLLAWWFGPGRVLAATARNGISHRPTPDAFTLLMKFGDVPVTLQSHYVTAYRHQVQVFGTMGNLYWPMDEQELLFQPQRAGDIEPLEEVPLPHASEVDAMKAFAQAIRAGTAFHPNGRDGLASLQLVYDAVEMAR